MKKIIRLTESELTRIVRRVISEEMNTSSFTKNSKVKIPIKKDNTFIVINIKFFI
jgi:tRNA threonylcarbamoyladenosine modification (KEOPS) complex  Pcc1 subunit